MRSRRKLAASFSPRSSMRSRISELADQKAKPSGSPRTPATRTTAPGVAPPSLITSLRKTQGCPRSMRASPLRLTTTGPSMFKRPPEVGWKDTSAASSPLSAEKPRRRQNLVEGSGVLTARPTVFRVLPGVRGFRERAARLFACGTEPCRKRTPRRPRRDEVRPLKCLAVRLFRDRSILARALSKEVSWTSHGRTSSRRRRSGAWCGPESARRQSCCSRSASRASSRRPPPSSARPS